MATKNRIDRISKNLANACLFGGALVSAGVADAAFINGSFETGDFTGWSATTTQSAQFQYLAVRPAGSPATVGAYVGGSFSSGFPVTDGNYSASHGFDGSAGTISISQNVLVDGTSLLFDWGAEIYSYSGTVDREFNVNIRDLGGTLQSSTNLFSVAGGSGMNDSGIVLDETLDISAFLGTTVNIEFEWIVPESYTGPGGAFLDNVRLEGGSVPVPGTLPLLLAPFGLMWGLRRRRWNHADRD